MLKSKNSSSDTKDFVPVHTVGISLASLRDSLKQAIDRDFEHLKDSLEIQRCSIPKPQKYPSLSKIIQKVKDTYQKEGKGEKGKEDEKTVSEPYLDPLSVELLLTKVNPYRLRSTLKYHHDLENQGLTLDGVVTPKGFQYYKALMNVRL